ncbi:hypothetical protein TSAR_015322 [Trichomalopsis sarcophagae]|uniref:HTH psq-type domain-containing protein n=1 Tax=Trichomalopsis sarcophagae TaxID=543379 RepID=A0A232EPF6_9HYME|nr:hypothetical protein TSAR_015322 [Trichomalopsis sarcophagae]
MIECVTLIRCRRILGLGPLVLAMSLSKAFVVSAALAAALRMCAQKVSFVSRVIPRYFTSFLVIVCSVPTFIDKDRGKMADYPEITEYLQGYIVNASQDQTQNPRVLAILAMVHLDTHISLRTIQREMGVPRSTYSRYLKFDRYHPYHITLKQDLNEQDRQQRVQFYQWARNTF